jgi:hypothetical protein
LEAQTSRALEATNLSQSHAEGPLAFTIGLEGVVMVAVLDIDRVHRDIVASGIVDE